MKPKFKKLWLAALRSGKYRRGRGQLRRANNTYCCLGVLCDVLGADPKEYGELHDQQLHKVGLKEDDQNTLSAINDGRYEGNELKIIPGYRHGRGASFAAIADYIEKNL